MCEVLHRNLFATLVLGLSLLAVAVPSGAVDQPADGVTARISFDGSIGDLVLVADDDGDYHATVAIFQETDGAWEQVQLWATLRVFEDSLSGGIDRVSIPFQSSADAPVTVAFSGQEFTGGALDVFVTFSGLGVDPDTGRVPTSHHHVAKNVAIDQGDNATADSLDHHSTRVVAF